MSLTSEESNLTRGQAFDLLRQLREEFSGILRMADSAPQTIPNPWAVDASARVACEAISLADLILADATASPQRVRAAVNLLYEVRNANAYLVRAAKVPPAPLLPPSRPSSHRT